MKQFRSYDIFKFKSHVISPSAYSRMDCSLRLFATDHLCLKYIFKGWLLSGNVLEKQSES